MAKTNLYLGLGALFVAAIGAFVWVPADTGTGIIVRVRSQVSVGDAFAPMLAFAILAIGALLLVVFERDAAAQPTLDPDTLKHTAAVMLVIVLGLLVMRYSGPMVLTLVDALTGQSREYRLLRDTLPWKYLGYVFGGSLIVGGMISLSAGRVRAGTVLVAVLATLALVALYDLPVDDLLLPPNGDF